MLCAAIIATSQDLVLKPNLYQSAYLLLYGLCAGDEFDWRNRRIKV